MKVLIVFVVGVLVISTISCLLVWYHTTVLERRMTLGLRATKLWQGKSDYVRVSGFCGASALSVRRITTERSGSSIVMLVHVALAHSASGGNFDYLIPVPDGVNEIRFGKERTLIWTRKTGFVSLNSADLQFAVAV